jgi:excisionase family DNA binding protein
VSVRLLTADEVAVLLAVPVSWVRESTRSGAIPCVELGRYRRYREAAVLAWSASWSPARVAAAAGGSAATLFRRRDEWPPSPRLRYGLVILNPERGSRKGRPQNGGPLVLAPARTMSYGSVS